jgi:hypothetical protein
MASRIASSATEVVRQIGPDTYLTIERVITKRQKCTCGHIIPMASDEKHAKCIRQEFQCPKCHLTWATCTPEAPRDGKAWQLMGTLKPRRNRRGARKHAKKVVLPSKEE